MTETPGRIDDLRPASVALGPQGWIHPLAAYALRRLAAGLAIALLVSLLVFAATQFLPGDAATAVLGRSASPESVAALRKELGLDRSRPEQYAAWLADFVRGDLGTSLTARRPVGELIGGRILNSALLALVTFAVLIPLSLLFGVLAAIRRGRTVDHVISGLSVAAIALPEFVTGTILVFAFAVSLKLLPPVSLVPPGESPLRHPSILVLPVATLLVAGLAYSIRMVRAGMVEAMASDYVEMSRLNGVPERRIIWHHALPNALAPTIQVFALTIQWLVGGLVVVETVFQYPGIGQGLALAVVGRDIPVVQAVATMIAVLYIAINIVADIIVVLLIPKLRTSYS